jgi:hypothetical protein
VPSDTLRTGVVNGTLIDGAAGVSPFSLSFSACFRRSFCPI